MLLVVNLFAPLFGPLFVALLGRNRWLMSALDGFVIVLLGGLLATHILPGSLEMLGWPAVVALMVGLALPKLLHHHDHARPGRLVMVAALLALSLHALMDGAAMGGPAAVSGDGAIDHDSLLVAVGVHRLLEGTGTWWLLGRYVAAPVRLGAMLGLTLLTAGGYLAGQAAAQGGLGEAAALLQVAVAGSLVHVLVWHPATDHAACSLPRSRAPSRAARFTSLLGGFLAAAALTAFERLHEDGHGHAHAHSGAHTDSLAPLLAALSVVCAAALLALGCAVVAHALTAHAQIIGPGRFQLGQAVRGAVRGLFVPACSCGAVSLAAARRREGLPEPGVLAYLLTAPAMGWLGWLLSLVLLGPVMALLRALGSVVLATVAASLWAAAPAQAPLGVRAAGAGLADPADPADPDDEKAKAGGARGAAAGHKQAHDAHWPPAANGGRSWARKAWLRLADGFDFVAGEMLDFSAPWLALGLSLTALLLQHTPPAWLAPQAAAHVDVYLLAALAVPVYLCAAAGTLVAWFLWQAGASMGAVLTFCWLASSLSMAAFTAKRRWYGQWRALGIAATQGAVAVALGQGVNLASEQVPMLALAAWPPDYQGGSVTFVTVPTLLAMALFAVALWRQGLRGFAGQILWANGPQEASGHHAADGASCAHAAGSHAAHRGH